jgi:hypothetical protein
MGAGQPHHDADLGSERNSPHRHADLRWELDSHIMTPTLDGSGTAHIVTPTFDGSWTAALSRRPHDPWPWRKRTSGAGWPAAQPGKTQKTQQKQNPTPKPREGQVHPTARSLTSPSPNVHPIRFLIHTKGTALSHFGKTPPGRPMWKICQAPTPKSKVITADLQQLTSQPTPTYLAGFISRLGIL